jgi:hypothetical protein
LQNAWVHRQCQPHPTRLKSGADMRHPDDSSRAHRDFRPTGLRRNGAHTPFRPFAHSSLRPPDGAFILQDSRANTHFPTGGRPGLDTKICRQCGLRSHGQGRTDRRRTA